MKHIFSFIEANRLPLAAGAAVLALAGCGGDDTAAVTMPPPGGVPLVAGTDIPVAATVDYMAALEFVAGIVAGGGSETADPIRVGDVTLATSETAEPDPRF